MNDSSNHYKEKNYELVYKKNIEYFEKNRELNKIKCQKYRKETPEIFKTWVHNNLEKRRKYINEYNQNHNIKLKNSFRSRINQYITKKNKSSTLDFVGCDIDYLMKYLESKFTDGMSWENYGLYGWHIDHIIPLSSAKTEEEIYELYHYKNLQPLWAEDNLKKSNKILT
jgi:hypothetical protein